MRRVLRTILVLTPTLALVVAAIYFFSQPTPVHNGEPGGDPAAAEGGRLLVLVVFDQMRGDYLERWAGEFGPDGFELLKRNLWYSNCLLPYACSATAPGHASLATGAPPSVHGIVENGWFDRGTGKLISSSAGDTVFHRVPSGDERGPGLSPERLLAPTLSDALKDGTGGKGRLFSLSLKDRSAVLLGGREPAGVYCFDNGEFHTSTYYRASLPAWVDQFNKSGAANRHAGKTWERLGSKEVYDRLAGRDDQPGENAPVITMPKPLAQLEERARYYFDVEASPYGNDLLWEFARTAIAAEKLGANGTTDVLCLSFSSNDTTGHLYGPDSHEVMDITLRSDRLMADMIKHLDATLGREKYTLIVTADHGIAPLPEVAVKEHPGAKRIIYGELVNGLDEALDETFGKPNGTPGRWIDADFKVTRPWVFLNRRLIDSTGIPYETVEAYAAKWLANRPDADGAFRRTNLVAGTCLPEEKLVFDAVRLAFHPDRCGDIYVVQKPYLQLTGTIGKGVDHGTVYEYDRRVFVLGFGARVPQLGRQTAPFDWLSVTTAACRTLNIAPPAKALKQLPPGW